MVEPARNVTVRNALRAPRARQSSVNPAGKQSILPILKVVWLIETLCYILSPPFSHHVHHRRARVCRVLLRLLPQRPGPAGPPLQPHLLRPLPGENVQTGWGHPLRLLPSVPLDYLHPGQPDPVRGPVGQHGDLGPYSRGAAVGEARRCGGFKHHKDPAH